MATFSSTISAFAVPSRHGNLLDDGRSSADSMTWTDGASMFWGRITNTEEPTLEDVRTWKLNLDGEDTVTLVRGRKKGASLMVGGFEAEHLFVCIAAEDGATCDVVLHKPIAVRGGARDIQWNRSVTKVAFFMRSYLLIAFAGRERTWNCTEMTQERNELIRCLSWNEGGDRLVVCTTSEIQVFSALTSDASCRPSSRILLCSLAPMEGHVMAAVVSLAGDLFVCAFARPDASVWRDRTAQGEPLTSSSSAGPCGSALEHLHNVGRQEESPASSLLCLVSLAHAAARVLVHATMQRFLRPDLVAAVRTAGGGQRPCLQTADWSVAVGSTCHPAVALFSLRREEEEWRLAELQEEAVAVTHGLVGLAFADCSLLALAVEKEEAAVLPAAPRDRLRAVALSRHPTRLQTAGRAQLLQEFQASVAVVRQEVGGRDACPQCGGAAMERVEAGLARLERRVEQLESRLCERLTAIERRL